MITIEQLLESVDLDFEPRFVTKDDAGDVMVSAEKPTITEGEYIDYWSACGKYVTLERLKLAEFENKDWQECIYEVPRKTTGKIEKLTEASIGKDGDVPSLTSTVNVLNIIINRLNQVIDAVNESKGAKNE